VAPVLGARSHLQLGVTGDDALMTHRQRGFHLEALWLVAHSLGNILNTTLHRKATMACKGGSQAVQGGTVPVVNDEVMRCSGQVLQVRGEVRVAP
jgi:hypothetical protein